jgi:hypothetical protein
MASGIVSVAAHEQRHGVVSAALALIAAVVWVALVVLSSAGRSWPPT